MLDRFGQIEPKVLLCADGYFYNGKEIDSLGTGEGVRGAGPEPEPHRRSALREAKTPDVSEPGAWRITYGDFLEPHAAREIPFKRLAFNAPLVIMYSSGTTGKPKCIVHGQGGTLHPATSRSTSCSAT